MAAGGVCIGYSFVRLKGVDAAKSKHSRNSSQSLGCFIILSMLNCSLLFQEVPFGLYLKNSTLKFVDVKSKLFYDKECFSVNLYQSGTLKN
jgi:hypothetical protein